MAVKSDLLSSQQGIEREKMGAGEDGSGNSISILLMSAWLPHSWDFVWDVAGTERRCPSANTCKQGSLL